MFDWHGWVSIRGTADTGDSQESADLDEAASDAVTQFVDGLPKADGFET